MIKCKPGNCFKCIREGTEYDFAYECSRKVALEMTDDERFELVRDVFDMAVTELKEKGPKLLQRDAECLGDCLAFFYMFGLGNRMTGGGYRPRYITSEQINAVLPIMRRSTKKSMQAVGTLAVACGIKYKPVKCWLRMNRGYDGPRTRS